MPEIVVKLPKTQISVFLMQELNRLLSEFTVRVISIRMYINRTLRVPCDNAFCPLTNECKMYFFQPFLGTQSGWTMRKKLWEREKSGSKGTTVKIQ